MYIKITTVKTSDKTYRYAKLAKAIWAGDKPQEKIICTLGTVEDVLKSRNTIIKGLQGLSVDAPIPSRQKRPGRSRRRSGPGKPISIQTKRKIRSPAWRRDPDGAYRVKPKKKKRSKR